MYDVHTNKYRHTYVDRYILTYIRNWEARSRNSRGTEGGSKRSRNGEGELREKEAATEA